MHLLVILANAGLVILANAGLVILANAGIHLHLPNWRGFRMDPRVREGDGMSRVALPKLSRTVVDASRNLSGA